MPQFTTKLFFALLYLGILLFVSGRIVHQMGKFTGYIVLKPGQTERWVLRESTTEGMLATALRNMPMEIVGLNHFKQLRSSLTVQSISTLCSCLFIFHWKKSCPVKKSKKSIL